MSGLVLDAGALIAIDRNDRRMHRLMREAKESKTPVIIPANAVIQAWRHGSRQALLAKFLNEKWIEIVPVDTALAKASGELLRVTHTEDAVDASVVATAAKKSARTILTSDPGDIKKLGPTLNIEPI